MRRRQFIDAIRQRLVLLEDYPAERWRVEVLRPDGRRVLVMEGAASSLRTIRKFYGDIAKTVPCELVHLTVDRDELELSRSVVESTELDRDGVIPLARWRGRR